MADLDDLDEFLYGETDDLQPLGVFTAITSSRTTTPVTAPIDTDDHVFIDSAMVDRDEDDDDDEDDIDIVLDASIQSPTANDSVNESLVTLKPGEHRSVNNPIQNTTSDLPPSSSSIPNLNFDTIDQLALYENQPITEIPLDSFTDKPWRKPGEDISDYFNFGFNEDTWKIYCDRQRHLREEQTQLKRRFAGTVNTATTNMPPHPSLPPIPRPHQPTHMPVSCQQPFLPNAPSLQPSLNPPPVIQGMPTNLPPNIKLRTQDHQQQVQLPTQPAPAIPVQQQRVFVPKQPPAPAPKPVIQQQPSTGGGLASRLKLRAPIASLVKTEVMKPAVQAPQRSTPTSNVSTESLPGQAVSNNPEATQ